MIALTHADLHHATGTQFLSRIERQAVAIALHDAAMPLARAGIFGWLAGNRRSRPLADRRLEAIRAFVCESRRHGRDALLLGDELKKMGFNPDQVAALALIAR